VGTACPCDRQGWQRGAILTRLGNRHLETLQSEASLLANHEDVHLAEIECGAVILRLFKRTLGILFDTSVG
jgi:hypothetical protein